MARLLIHGTSHGKKTSRRLPKLKILIVREHGSGSYIFSVILVTDFQRLEDVFGSFAFGGKVLDVGINGSDRSNGGSGGSGGSGYFGIPDLLGVIVFLGFSKHLRGLAFVCAVSFLATSETESFPNASGMIRQRELVQMDGVNIHGVGIFGGAQIGGE